MAGQQYTPEELEVILQQDAETGRPQGNIAAYEQMREQVFQQIDTIRNQIGLDLKNNPRHDSRLQQVEINRLQLMANVYAAYITTVNRMGGNNG